MEKYTLAFLVMALGFATTKWFGYVALAHRGQEALGGEIVPLLIALAVSVKILSRADKPKRPPKQKSRAPLGNEHERLFNKRAVCPLPYFTHRAKG
jgi:hypothetical protein